MPIRSRIIPGVTGTGVSRASRFSSWQPYTVTGEGGQETSIGTLHGFRNGVPRGGGPWRLTRQQNTYLLGGVSSETCIGQAILRYPTTSWTPGVDMLGVLTDSQMNAAGATGIARSEPTNPSFSTATALGELMRDGVPALPGSDVKEKVQAARAAGSNYLNVEFGWLPLLSDLQGFARTVKKSSTILSDYKEGSNMWMKQSYHYPGKFLTAQRDCTLSTAPTSGGPGLIPGKETHTRDQHVWFEGKFRYFVPTSRAQSSKSAEYLSQAQKLLGVRPTPETVWNCAPWSWAADWFGNTGDILHNISAFQTDGLVMQYGFIMAHTWQTKEFYGSNSVVALSRTELREEKQRIQASPYGFGVLDTSLSAKQKAILVALGLSRT